MALVAQLFSLLAAISNVPHGGIIFSEFKANLLRFLEAMLYSACWRSGGLKDFLGFLSNVLLASLGKKALQRQTSVAIHLVVVMIAQASIPVPAQLSTLVVKIAAENDGDSSFEEALSDLVSSSPSNKRFAESVQIPRLICNLVTTSKIFESLQASCLVLIASFLLRSLKQLPLPGALSINFACSAVSSLFKRSPESRSMMLRDVDLLQWLSKELGSNEASLPLSTQTHTDMLRCAVFSSSLSDLLLTISNHEQGLVTVVEGMSVVARLTLVYVSSVNNIIYVLTTPETEYPDSLISASVSTALNLFSTIFFISTSSKGRRKLGTHDGIISLTLKLVSACLR